MINNEIKTTKGMESAQKALEQAKNRVALEKKKANEERRKAEDRHKYMMGGVVHKYFPECYYFKEEEMNEIIKVVFKTSEVQKNISNIKARANCHSLEISRSRYIRKKLLDDRSNECKAELCRQPAL